MISYSLPWTSDFERALYKAAFDKDQDAALAAAKLWFSSVDIEKVSYQHHRLIAAVGRRFDTATELQDRRAMFRNVSKQLWLRAVQNLRDAEHAAAALRDMRVPFAYAGHPVWLGLEDNRFLDCEEIELVVHENALGLVLRILCDHCWYPHARYEFDRTHKRIPLQGPRGLRFTLYSAAAVRALTKQPNEAFWAATGSTTTFGQSLRTLAPSQNLCLWRLRPGNPLQLLIDRTYAEQGNLRSQQPGLPAAARFGLWRTRRMLTRPPSMRGAA